MWRNYQQWYASLGSSPDSASAAPDAVYGLLKLLAAKQAICKEDPNDAASWIAFVARGLIQSDGVIIGAGVDHRFKSDRITPCVLIWPIDNSAQAQVLVWCAYDDAANEVALIWNI